MPIFSPHMAFLNGGHPAHRPGLENIQGLVPFPLQLLIQLTLSGVSASASQVDSLLAWSAAAHTKFAKNSLVARTVNQRNSRSAADKSHQRRQPEVPSALRLRL